VPIGDEGRRSVARLSASMESSPVERSASRFERRSCSPSRHGLSTLPHIRHPLAVPPLG
jgi:hypothetical protein